MLCQSSYCYEMFINVWDRPALGTCPIISYHALENARDRFVLGTGPLLGHAL